MTTNPNASEPDPATTPTLTAVPASVAAVLARLPKPGRHIECSNDSWITVEGDPTAEQVLDHLAGRKVLGAYPSADGAARLGVIDIDLHIAGRDPTPAEVATVQAYAVKKHDDLVARGVECLLVRGHTLGSYHIFFWLTPAAADRLGRYLKAFVADAGPIHVDVFPSVSGAGNAVRLPGRHHRRTDSWSEAWDNGEWLTWPAAFERLAALPDNPARLFPDPGKPKPAEKVVAVSATRPGDLFNLLVPVEDVLIRYGWAIEKEDGDRVRFTRPGKVGGVSASVKDGTVWVFTSSVAGLPASDTGGKPYTAFALVAHLEYGGDFHRAARELAVAGFCPAPKGAVGGVGSVGAVGQTAIQLIPTYRPFPVECLPPVVRGYVVATATAMNCPTPFSALPALAMIGAAIGSSYLASPKSGWREPPYIWGVSVAGSGGVKSPPYRDVEDIAQDVNDLLEMEFVAATAEYEARLEEWAIKKKEGEDPGPKPKPPVRRSFVKSDATIEALVGVLKDSGGKLLVAQDELSGWIGGFTRYAGQTGSSALPHWLQLHNAGAVDVTRKTGDRKEIRVRNVGVSVTGTIQPTILARVMTEEFRASGLLARLLLAMPPWQPRVWTEREVDPDTREEFAELVKQLHKLPSGTWPDGRPKPHLIGLTADAKAAFVKFFNENGEALATADEDSAAAMSKLEGYALRFALIAHCCRLREYAKDARITATDMIAAIHLTEWFRDEAARVYAALGQTAVQRAAGQLFDIVCRLADRLAPRRNGFRGVTARDLQNSNSRKYPSSESAEAALGSLVAAGLGVWAAGPDSDRRGGTRARYFIPRPTSDTSDTCLGDGDDPDDDSGGGSDTCPNPAPIPDAGAPVDVGVTDCLERNSGEVGGTPEKQVSDTSDVGGGVGSALMPRANALPRAGAESTCRTEGAGVGQVSPYTLVTDATALGGVVAAIGECGGRVGSDIESTGLDPLTDRVRLLQLATPTHVHIIDLFAIGDTTVLRDLFAALAAVEVVGHNLQFDIRFLARLGFVPGRVYDTMLAGQVLHAGRCDESGALLRHGLKDAAARELGQFLDKEMQVSDWSGELTPEQLDYAARDAAVLLPLVACLNTRLDAAGLTATAELEMRALPGVAWAGGVMLDRDAWLARATCAAAERDHLLGELRALDGGNTTRNWNSPLQVPAALQAAGVTVTSTADEVLAGIDHPLAITLRAYRAASKQVTSYGEKWVTDHVRPDGRVYASWRQLGAVTGRMSCSRPGLQQLPRGHRRCVVAGPGAVLVKADYSQIELRIAARLCGDARMIEAYRAGEDLHALTAAALLRKAVTEVSKDDRQLAKAVNFGLLYGQGAAGLSAYAMKEYGVRMTAAEARRHQEVFFRTYPGVRRWHRGIGDGPTDTHTLGGRRRVGVVRYTDKLNTPVQGTGADGLKAAVALLWERRADCPQARPVLYAHDEIVLEVPEADAAVAAEWLRRCMTDAMTPLIAPVPVAVEVTIGRTWAGE